MSKVKNTQYITEVPFSHGRSHLVAVEIEFDQATMHVLHSVCHTSWNPDLRVHRQVKEIMLTLCNQCPDHIWWYPNIIVLVKPQCMLTISCVEFIPLPLRTTALFKCVLITINPQCMLIISCVEFIPLPLRTTALFKCVLTLLLMKVASHISPSLKKVKE